MRSGHSSGKSLLAIRDIASAICARMALLDAFESAIMAGMSSLRRAVLSASGTGGSSCIKNIMIRQACLVRVMEIRTSSHRVLTTFLR